MPDAPPEPAPTRRRAAPLLWTCWGVIFALAYGQAPLFTFNQNTKLLQGLADAGWGTLSRDPLVHTTDPFPLFSGLVRVVATVAHPAAFHLIYAVLLGTYLWGCATIGAAVLRAAGRPADRAVRCLWLPALLVAGHSALARRVMEAGEVVFAGWPPALANQFLIGPVFEPASFGALIPVGVAAFTLNRPILAALLIGAATAMHPTYLPGCAVLLLTLIGWLSIRDRRHAAAAGMLAAFALPVVPQLVFFALTFGDDPRADAANDVLIHVRIPHHSLPELFVYKWKTWLVVGLIVAGIVAARGVVRAALVTGFALAAGGTLWCLAAEPGVVNLIAPWRASTLLTPLAFAAVLAWAAAWLANRTAGRRWPAVLVAVGAAGCAAAGVVSTASQYARQSRVPHAGVIGYAAEHGTADDWYLVPTDLADFRLRAGRATYVTRKSHPIKGGEVLDWHRRLLRADGLFAASPDAPAAANFAAEGATHVVVPLDSPAYEPAVAAGRVVYADDSYAVVKFR